jgi:hypothetical protein
MPTSTACSSDGIAGKRAVTRRGAKKPSGPTAEARSTVHSTVIPDARPIAGIDGTIITVPSAPAITPSRFTGERRHQKLPEVMCLFGSGLRSGLADRRAVRLSRTGAHLVQLDVVAHHPLHAEALFEALADGRPIEGACPFDSGDGLALVLTRNPVTPSSITSGTEPE